MRIVGYGRWLAVALALVCCGRVAYDPLATPASGDADADVASRCVRTLSLGDATGCALRADHTVWCWGLNSAGYVGDGTMTDRPAPVQITDLGSSVDELGERPRCALRSDRTLWCWGDNTSGIIGDGTTTMRLSPVQVTDLGGEVSWASIGFAHACAAKTDGTLWCWGDGVQGQIGDGAQLDRASPTQVMGLSQPVVAMTLSSETSLARMADGTIWAWGGSWYGELGDGTIGERTTPGPITALGNDVVQLVAGTWFVCARKQDGTMWCWGDNMAGQLADGTTTARSLPIQIAALGNSVVDMAAGKLHVCARTADGKLWCWGRGTRGELGDGLMIDQDHPVEVVGLPATPLAIAAGFEFTCAPLTNDGITCWGTDWAGQLGDGGASSTGNVQFSCP